MGRPKGSGAGLPMWKPFPMEERISTFWKRADIKGDDECWNWKFPPDPQTGYGRYSFQKKHTSAHRFAWIISRGTIPKGMCVCHHCDNRICVNPKHLFLGTIADNNADMIRKGRQSKAPRNNKISEDDVIKIRSMWKPYKVSVRKISETLKLGYKSCEIAVSKHHWKHIPWTQNELR